MDGLPPLGHPVDGNSQIKDDPATAQKVELVPLVPPSSSSHSNSSTFSPKSVPSGFFRSSAASDTESSSEEELFSHEFDDEEMEVLRQWEEQYVDIAWRWGWLQLQVHDLEREIDKSKELEEKLRQSKERFLPLFDESETCRSIRTSGFSLLSSHRKMCRQAPTLLSARNPILEGVDSHPLFSFQGTLFSFAFIFDM